MEPLNWWVSLGELGACGSGRAPCLPHCLPLHLFLPLLTDEPSEAEMTPFRLQDRQKRLCLGCTSEAPGLSCFSHYVPSTWVIVTSMQQKRQISHWLARSGSHVHHNNWPISVFSHMGPERVKVE